MGTTEYHKLLKREMQEMKRLNYIIADTICSKCNTVFEILVEDETSSAPKLCKKCRAKLSKGVVG